MRKTYLEYIAHKVFLGGQILLLCLPSRLEIPKIRGRSLVYASSTMLLETQEGFPIPT